MNNSLTHDKSIDQHPSRFHVPHSHLAPPFGGDWFGQKAEAFARFFGTPIFLGLQSFLVVLWVLLNATGIVQFDLYPFILLNLLFSLQSAYAAPLILLAQSRQADREKANTIADAQHRESLAIEAADRQKSAAVQSGQILELLRLNTELTKSVHELSLKLCTLTESLHGKQKGMNLSSVD